MEIYLHNTLTKNTEHFRPLKEGSVSMYNCGPTVYNKVHIGNLRSYIFADTLRRIFEYNGYKVDQVINITDVGHLTDEVNDRGEDKMEKGAREQNKTAKEIAKEYTNYFYECLEKLNIDTNDIRFPKATDHIEEQIEMIKELEKKGFTYKTSDGIYFNSSKFKDYGKLGGIDLKGLREGARIPSKDKKNTTDFALWKFSKENEKRQQEWNAPWGIGFPGWHIECSAMSRKYLGDQFDIHTGGIDHIPIHHNNEIAQSESITGKIQAKFWMHHGHVLLNNEKIAKSTGGDLYIEDLENKNISPSAYRYWTLTADYKTQTNYTDNAVFASQTALQKIIELFRNEEIGEIDDSYKEKFRESVNNDLDTARGIAILWEMLKDKNINNADKYATILDFDRVLGLDIQNLILNNNSPLPNKIKDLASDRESARRSGDFKKADTIRKVIESEGYEIKDTDEGPFISKK